MAYQYGAHLQSDAPYQYGRHLSVADTAPEEPTPSFNEGDIRDNGATAAIYNFAKSVPFAEKAAAAIKAPIKSMLSGGGLEGVGDAYNQERDNQKALNQAFDTQHNDYATGGAIGGAFLNPANWALGKAGLVANAGLQAGSDTDFTKDGSAGDFAEKAGKNLLLGKLVEKGVGAITGSNATNRIANMLRKEIPESELTNSVQFADKAKNLGADLPMGATPGDNIARISQEAASAPAANKTVRQALTTLLPTVGKKMAPGSMGKEVSDIYEGAKQFTLVPGATKKAPQVAEMMTQAAKDNPATTAAAGKDSGEIFQIARKEAKKIANSGERDKVGAQFEKVMPGQFAEADAANTVMNQSRSALAKVLQASRKGTKADTKGAVTAATGNPFLKPAAVVVKGVRAATGAVLPTIDNTVVKYLSTGNSGQRRLANLLLNRPAAETADIIGKSKKSVADLLLQTGNRNASAIERYLPYAIMRSTNK